MNRLRIAAATAAILATLGTAATASAAPPQAVSITVLTQVEGSGDQFAATGGVVCATGTVSNGPGHFVGGQSTSHAQILLVKEFVCGDGTFDVLLRVNLDFETGETVGTWSVLRGTGAYESLHGAGSIVGERQTGETILDTYTGRLHVD